MMKNKGQEEWPATEIFYKNRASRERVIVNIGGARSSKSYSICQLFASRYFQTKRKKFLTIRKTFPALRTSTYEMAIEMLKEKNLYKYMEHNKSEHTLRDRRSGNLWLFSSLDEPEKIKSSEFNWIHMEEANEFTYEDFTVLKLRLSAPVERGMRNQIFISLNPSDIGGWVKTQLLEKERCDVIYSTYKDNPFLSEDYKAGLEALRKQDESLWMIYGLGQWALMKGIIYGAPKVVNEWPEGIETIYGLDFGFNNPSVLLEIGLKEFDAYFKELIYKTRLTNAELIDLMKEKIDVSDRRRRPIYADAAEPARIKEIEDAGFLIYPATKNVKDRIDLMKRYKRHVMRESVNCIREFGNYKNRVDRNGVVTDEPVKWEDHCPDAAGYAVYTHTIKEREGGVFIGFSKRAFI
jgi:phage terminase large subunit